MGALLFWIILGRLFFGTISAWSHDSDNYRQDR